MVNMVELCRSFTATHQRPIPRLFSGECSRWHRSGILRMIRAMVRSVHLYWLRSILDTDGA